ncbi:ChaN family lipoprotein [Desulfosarcina alkanivorans]|uniref:ChaN family lipoprotein n=1 Tax=Desulfosarcina alkanivorans TaxID=571177 RepID=UPI00142EBFA3|nr:ChaN family lipoprotein [Desulfosarcina alkanivorans]
MTPPCDTQAPPLKGRKSFRHKLWAFIALVMAAAAGCAVAPKTLSIKGQPTRLMENTILKTDTASVVTRQQMIADLARHRVVYVGESHTNPSHHAIQLEVIRALAQNTSNLVIGMEMFDHTYQAVLDRWVAGELDETAFLQQTHWYANWRFNFGLYRDILEYAKEKGIRIIALNVPFHIPPRIRVGGIASLSEADRRHLPAVINTTDAGHRAYLQEIFNLHAFRGRDTFDFFYEAQCTWEDAMAEAVADHPGPGTMVVLAGNGHIIRKFGIPNRAFARVNAPFKTVYLASVGDEAELSWADYLWVTPDQRMPHGRMMGGVKKKK